MTEKKYYGYQQIFEIDQKRKELEKPSQHKKLEDTNDLLSDPKSNQNISDADLNLISDPLDQRSIDQDQQKHTITRVPNDLDVIKLRHSDSDVTSLSHRTTQTLEDSDVIPLSREKTKSLHDQVGYYQIPNYIDDELLPTLNSIEQIVYRRLYRLSYGFNRQTTDSVGLNKLAEKCNLGTTAIKKAIKSLEQRGHIQIHSDNSRDPKGGNKYTVLLKKGISLDATQLRREKTKSSNAPITSHDDHDNDDLKRSSSSKEENDEIFLSQHYLETKQIYEEVTGNIFNKLDKETYKKIKHIQLPLIEQTIKIVKQRAESKPNSLNYFIKEILNLSDPRSKTRTQQKKQLEKIIKEVQSSYIGSKPSITDICESVKRRCANDGVIYDNDLFNKILGL